MRTGAARSRAGVSIRVLRARPTRAIAASTAVLVTLLLVTTGVEPDAHASHGMPMVAVSPDAFAAGAPVLPRAGWTATASDAESVHEDGAAANVLDGDPATIWHSAYWTTLEPLPHWITLDLQQPTEISGLQYLPRQDGNANGRIGRFAVRVSTDGAHWQLVARGTWADDATQQTAAFELTSARYVRLTALTEAGGRGPWTSAAELNLLGVPPTDPPAARNLSRKGWTANASDYEPGTSSPYNVLDDDPATQWQTTTSGQPADFPHWITIDMQAPRRITGLSYLPPLGGGRGTIGDYQVVLSVDGWTWTDPVAAGTWADDTSRKLAVFAATTARYVRLVATSEAGDRGPYTAAAEIDVLGPLNPAVAGQWGPVISFPLVPVSTVLLPDDKVLTFSAWSPDWYTESGGGKTETAILDLNTGVVSSRLVSDTGHEMFCSGLALLPDGRLLVAGGSDDAATSIYDPATDTWATGPPLNIPRGYESAVTLSDGRVFTLGGSWSGGIGGKDAEVFTPNGTWQLKPGITAQSILTHDKDGVYRADNHGWFFAVAGGQVFHAGPSKHMHWFDTAGAGSVANAGKRADSADAMNGNAVLYDVGKILTVGGSPDYDGTPATDRAYTIDISGGPSVRPVVTRTGNLHFARGFANSVVLPDGTVFTVGGQSTPAPFSDKNARLQPELWSPETGDWTAGASMAVPRDYHSVAVLLPDGRVLTAGGGLCGPCLTNHPDAQIYTPPYLLKGDGSLRVRPKITSAPAEVVPGRLIKVKAGTDVRAFALVRVGSATHAIDTDQRRVPVPSTSDGAGPPAAAAGRPRDADPGQVPVVRPECPGHSERGGTGHGGLTTVGGVLTVLPERILGRTGRPVSVVGLGTWQLGADWGDVASPQRSTSSPPPRTPV